MDKDKDKNKESLSHKLIIGIILGVILIWGVYWFLAFSGFGGWENRGQFGDMFGALNALFSGLAFAGVIIAIFLQKEELRLQREEMERFTKAQEGSEKALNDQAETLKTTAKLNAMNSLISNYDPILAELVRVQKNMDKTTASVGGQLTPDSKIKMEKLNEINKRITGIQSLRQKVLFDLESFIGDQGEERG